MREEHDSNISNNGDHQQQHIDEQRRHHTSDFAIERSAPLAGSPDYRPNSADIEAGFVVGSAAASPPAQKNSAACGAAGKSDRCCSTGFSAAASFGTPLRFQKAQFPAIRAEQATLAATMGSSRMRSSRCSLLFLMVTLLVLTSWLVLDTLLVGRPSPPPQSASYNQAAFSDGTLRHVNGGVNGTAIIAGYDYYNYTTSTDHAQTRAELGHSSWTFLHTMAAKLPPVLSSDVQFELRQFMMSFAKFFPCPDCSAHFQTMLRATPFTGSTQSDFALWLCTMHNNVNTRLGKPVFDCNRLSSRWDCGCMGVNHGNNETLPAPPSTDNQIVTSVSLNNEPASNDAIIPMVESTMVETDRGIRVPTNNDLAASSPVSNL